MNCTARNGKGIHSGIWELISDSNRDTQNTEEPWKW